MGKFFDRIKSVADFLEGYFSGGAQGASPAQLREIISFKGRDLSQGWWMILNSGDEDKESIESLEIKSSHLAEAPIVIVVAPAANSLHLKKIRALLTGSVVILSPSYLEMALHMVLKLARELKKGFVVVLVNVSQLPSKREVSKRDILSAIDGEYSRVFCMFFARFKRLHLTYGCPVITMENEAILGQKNSAFLQRLFFRNTVIEPNRL